MELLEVIRFYLCLTLSFYLGNVLGWNKVIDCNEWVLSYFVPMFQQLWEHSSNLYVNKVQKYTDPMYHSLQEKIAYFESRRQ